MLSLNNDSPLDGQSISDFNARIPRNVYYDGVFVKVMIGTLFVLLVGVIWAVWSSYDTLKNTRIERILRRQGTMTIGSVVKRSIDHNDVYVRYRFVVDGVPYLGEAEMKTGHSVIPLPGKEISILYLPANPQINQPSKWEWFSAWDIFRPIYVLLTIVISAILIGVGLRQRTLVRMGVVVEGRVASCVRNEEVFRVHYRFESEGGLAWEGSSDVADEYEVGTSIPVIYLRDNPKRNDRYPVSGFRIAD
jgi:hypothetical protein